MNEKNKKGRVTRRKPSTNFVRVARKQDETFGNFVKRLFGKLRKGVSNT